MNNFSKILAGMFSLFLLFSFILTSTSFAATNKDNDEDYYEEEYTIPLDNEKEGIIEPKVQAAWFIGLPREKWTIKNKKYIGQTINYNKRLWTVSGNPGITLRLDHSFQVQAGVTATFGMSKSDISAQIGFNVSKSYTTTSSGTYKVPSKYKGKKVKRAELSAYPIFNNWSYKVYYDGIASFGEVYKGTGKAYKPSGVHFKKKIYYNK
ncbi:hypothetical protein MOC99_21885 [Bacillus haynesii]|uniref:hypothetical protein n=1 Tax=Bacillus haynesii TaxID=1925021 RepID=UPI002281587F|nr:hypothetical protein [Bacillus haynesii]MCY7772041.1 hypothetical protein [Bacillus haynesii]MCY8343249.1 hypothetical protein [Bacillus haynesii]MCY8348154.1 hypothetical protein [Bacillus haynesii]MCY8352450.1 hypothetical protein [Bacillus haynesii]MCY8558345.1 hypothetical protein [Bacillus haynesii]